MNTTGPTPHDHGDPAGASAAPPTHPPSGSAPPTQRDQYEAEPRRPVWPTPLGIIAIILASLGILLTAWSLIATFVITSVFETANSAAPQMSPAMLSTGYQLALLVSNLAYLALAVMLLVAGIQLLRRRPGAWQLSITWAILKMIVVVIGLAIGYFVQQAQMEQMNQVMQQHGSPFPGNAMMSMQRSFMLVGMIFGLLWGWAVPIFTLIWMTREKVKNDVAQWEKGASM